MKAINWFFAPMLFAFYSSNSAPYELATHARITLEAFNQSVLNLDPLRIRSLGIPSIKYSTQGSEYVDMNGNSAEIRHIFDYDFDFKKMPGVEDGSADKNIPRRVYGWLMRGSIREDDSGILVGNVVGEREPQDDPYSNFNRWCNHFFDPLSYNRLTDPYAAALCLSFLNRTYASAPVWASGAIDPFQTPQQEQVDRRNHFTLYDAREAMWRALTGRDRNQGPVAASGVERKAYWATTFRSLGNVLHLNQDMAQPQHTRNESHGTTDAGAYEKYIDARAKGDKFFKIDGRIVSPAAMPPLIYAGYSPPRFAHYSKYWSTDRGPASTESGRGLADYSNRGFFTPAANINDSGYTTPSHDLSKYGSIPIITGAVKEEYLTAPVPDKYLNQLSSPIRMTRRSEWDDALVALDGFPTGATFSLDQATFDDRVSLLLPRAVGYSAGLLDYFFNGRLTIEIPDEGAYAIADHSTGQGFTKIRLKLTNTTPPLLERGTQYPQNMINGTVVAVVKFHRNICYRSDLAGEYGAPSVAYDHCRDRLSVQTNPPIDIDDSAESIVVSAPKPLSLDAGATVPLDFDFGRSPIPFGATDIYLQVVYRGPLGPDTLSAEKDVVVVGTKDIAEPTYFSYFNASDYVHIGSSVYPRKDVVDNQDLLAQVRPEICVGGTAPNRRLLDDCFTPFELTMKFGFSNLSDPAVFAIGLPSRRYLRFAFLTDLAPGVAAAAAPRLHLHVETSEANSVTSDGSEKVLLLQQSNCLPLDPVDILPVRTQLQFESDPPSFMDSAKSLWKLRGVYGYAQAACVINGDGSDPRAADDRNLKLSVLPLGSTEALPYPVIIAPAFLSP